MSIRLARPEITHKDEALAFKQEFFEHGEKVINGSEMLDCMDSYEDWLKSVTTNADPDTVNPQWVLTDTFFAIDNHDKIVGIIDLRHSLNDFLINFGHSGYSVRPSERKQGYATKMLSLIIDVAKEAGLPSLQLSVERSNEPSIKTILKNGAKYERSFEYEGEEADIYRIMF